jgi:hypothetical protein
MTMRRLFLTLALLLAASTASASVPYSIEMLTTEDPASCTSALPAAQGLAFFDVNKFPIPGYTTSYDSAPKALWAYLDSNFDSTLLFPGSNEIDFGIATTNSSDYCTISRHQVTMYDALGGSHFLFDVTRTGTAFKGATTVSLDLNQIDPNLAADLIKFKNAIADDEADMLKNAASSDALSKELDRLSELENLLDDLLKKGFDQISQADLDAILDQYSDVGPDVKAALDQLLADLKKDIQQYRDEIAQLVSTFHAQADKVTDGIVTGGARLDGFDPSNGGNYTAGADTGSVPDVPVPQIGTDPFDPTHDPYAIYAASILAQLNATVYNGKVQDRATFQSIVEGWRTNQHVVQHALELRAGVSQAEWGAFLNAQTSVLTFLRQFMDDNGWFRDVPIPAELKGLVDLIMAARFANQSKALKQALNGWAEAQLTPQQQLFADTLLSMKDVVVAYDEEVAEEPEVATTMSKFFDGAIVVAKEVGKLALYVSPVGPFIAICEAAWGHELCLPSGRSLSKGERIFSAAGVFVGGSVKLWKKLGSTGMWDAVGKAAALDRGEIGRVYQAVEQGGMGFTKVGAKTFKSAAGLIYTPTSMQGHRVAHLLLHGFVDASQTKASHSVFVGALEDILKVVDEGWLKKGGSILSKGNDVYFVDMGRVIGTLGEKQLKIVVVHGTAELVTAHPWP